MARICTKSLRIYFILRKICEFYLLFYYNYHLSVYRRKKNLSSKTVTFHCVTLLVTDTVILVAGHLNHHPFWCRFIGIFLHWLVLAAQLWTPITAFDLVSKFCKVSQVIVKTNHVRLAVYSVTAYGITTIIVDATILLHKYQTNNAGYGGQDFCYIASPQSKIYCDILPMFMIFLTTLIFSTHILCHLWKREKKHVEFYERLVDMRTIFFILLLNSL